MLLPSPLGLDEQIAELRNEGCSWVFFMESNGVIHSMGGPGPAEIDHVPWVEEIKGVVREDLPILNEGQVSEQAAIYCAGVLEFPNVDTELVLHAVAALSEEWLQKNELAGGIGAYAYLKTEGENAQFKICRITRHDGELKLWTKLDDFIEQAAIECRLSTEVGSA